MYISKNPERRAAARRRRNRNRLVLVLLLLAAGLLTVWGIQSRRAAQTPAADVTAQPDATEPPAVTEPPEEGGTPQSNRGSAWYEILVNAENPLSADFVPEVTEIRGGNFVDTRILDDLQDMMDDCRAAGLDPMICSGYRSYTEQTALYNDLMERYMEGGQTREEAAAAAAAYVAPPGTSEHQTGLALDIVSSANQNLDESQLDTPEQAWLMENAWKYGFILRYPQDKVQLTGIAFEPWHYRYVGKQAAQEIYSQGLCLEEYLSA